MRVLFIVNTFPPAYTGGAEVANYHTCRALQRQGIDCSILLLNNRVSQFTDDWYRLDGIPVHRVTHRMPRTALSDLFDLRIYRATRRELNRLRPDLVHVHNVSGATLAPYLACRRAGVPTINTLHDLWLLCPNNMLYRSDGSFCDPRANPSDCGRCFQRYDFWANIPFRRRVFAALTSNVRFFVSPSQAVIDRHVEAGYAASRFRLVRLGLEESTPRAPTRGGAEASLRPVGQRSILFAGGGTEIKGARVVLQALPTLLQRLPDLRLIVAGGGENAILAEMQRYAPAVESLGTVWFDDMQILYRQADLTIVASTWHENSPLVIYESYAAGTPVVASNVGGIPELVRHGETGYLFATGNPSALADAISGHFSRPAQERRRMRQRCVQELRTRLTLQKHVQGLLQVYREALSA